jgi:hypothetical protein
LTAELSAWTRDSWAALGVDLDLVAAALVSCWERGDVRGLTFPLREGEDPRAMVRPASTLTPARSCASGRHAGERFL